MLQPPSTTMFWPVIYFDASLNKNTRAPVRSSVSAILLPIIVFLEYCVTNDSDWLSWTPPGDMAFTLMSCLPRYEARYFVRLNKAPFIAEYSTGLVKFAF